jgi:hypothetical protein
MFCINGEIRESSHELDKIYWYKGFVWLGKLNLTFQTMYFLINSSVARQSEVFTKNFISVANIFFLLCQLCTLFLQFQLVSTLRKKRHICVDNILEKLLCDYYDWKLWNYLCLASLTILWYFIVLFILYVFHATPFSITVSYHPITFFFVSHFISF